MLAARLLIAAILLLSFAGCASKPRPLAEEAAEQRIPGLGEPAENAENLEVAELWIEDFDDPRLQNLITQTLENNPDAAAAAARLRAAAAVSRIAGADRLPQLSAQALGSRARSVTRVPTPDGGEDLVAQTGSRYELGLNLSWEIDLWGRIADARQAAIFDQEASAAQFAGTRLGLATAVARAWFRATALHLQEQLALKQLEVSEKSLLATEDRVNRGLLGSLELSLARSQVESAKSALQSRIREKRNAFRQVQALTGAFPDGDFSPANDLPTLETPPPAALPAEILARRPDLIAASLTISAADSRLSEAEKRLIPSISLTGGYGTASDELSDLLDSNFTVWNLAGNLLQPVFQGGRIRAEVARRDALLAAAVADFESTLLTAFREVEDALDSDETLRTAAAQAEEAARLAQEAASLGFDRYERGLIELLDVLELQNRAFDAYNLAVDLRLGALLNRINLYAALGGGFEPTVAPNPVLSKK